jgi:hypothetical protein
MVGDDELTASSTFPQLHRNFTATSLQLHRNFTATSPQLRNTLPIFTFFCIK